MLPLSFLNGWFEGATDHPQVSLALSRYLLPLVLEFLALDDDVSYVAPAGSQAHEKAYSVLTAISAT